MRKSTIAFVAVFVAAGLSGCASSGLIQKGQIKDVISQDMNQKTFVEAIGIGAADPALDNLTQRRSLSRDAAIVKAQYEMLSVVKGVEIEGGITVARAMETDSTLEARMKEVIKGAEIMKTEFTKDDGAAVTLRLPKKRLEEMMGIKFK